MWVYDIEQYPNFHSGYFINANTNEEKVFILWYSDDSEEINQSIEYYEFLNQLSINKIPLIGFNNLGYDYSIIHHFMNNQKHYNNIKSIIKILKSKNDDIIYNNHLNKFKSYSIPEKYHKIPQIDLYKIHHFDNAARSTSLKRLAINMRWHDIRDLPLSPDTTIKKEQINDILTYNRNDVLITKELYWLTKGNKDKITVSFPGMEEYYINKDRIAFREEISKQYNIDCVNFSDVKIGEEINRVSLLKNSKFKWDDIKNLKTHRTAIHLRDLIPNYIKYSDKNLNNLLNEIKNTTITIGNESFIKQIIFANNIWTFGLGGIHTKDTGRIITPKSNEIFEEKDVSSMYPNKIITAINSETNNQGLYPAHLGIEWLNEYIYNKDLRIKLKNKAKTDTKIKMVVDVLKLALNGGGYGKTGDIYNWQYDPLVKYTTTIQCQLDILMLADMLYSAIPLQIESGNTDGINIIYDKKYKQEVENICKIWESITCAELETTEYQKIIRTTVNDYMAIKTDGSVKYKGDFEINKELHKNSSMYIVYKAIDNYYRFSIPVKQTISECKNIYDFCKSVSIRNTPQGKWIGIYDTITNNQFNQIETTKNIRYYIDDTGQGKLRKLCYEGKSKNKIINIEANNSVTLFNQYIKLDNFDEYRVNLNYYIKEANKIITNVHDGQLTLF